MDILIEIKYNKIKNENEEKHYLHRSWYVNDYVKLMKTKATVLFFFLCIYTAVGVDAQVVKTITVESESCSWDGQSGFGPLYAYDFEYDTQGRVSTAIFRGGPYQDSLYKARFYYRDYFMRVNVYKGDAVFPNPQFWYVDYYQDLDDGLIKKEYLHVPANSWWAIYDPVDSTYYQYDENSRIIHYRDEFRNRNIDLQFTRGEDGNIVEVAPYENDHWPSTLTFEYDDDTQVSEASLRLASSLPWLASINYVVYAGVHALIQPINLIQPAFQWAGYYGKPDTKLIKRIEEKTDYFYYTSPNDSVAITQYTSLSFDYVIIDENDLIYAVDAVYARDSYMDKELQPFGTECHESRKMRFYFIWDETITGIKQPTVTDDDNTEVARYSLSGERLFAPQRGVNIVKMKNGQTKKVIVK